MDDPSDGFFDVTIERVAEHLVNEYFFDLHLTEEADSPIAYRNKFLAAYLEGQKTAKDTVTSIRWAYKEELDNVNYLATQRQLEEAEKESIQYLTAILQKPDEFFVDVLERAKEDLRWVKESPKSLKDLLKDVALEVEKEGK